MATPLDNFRQAFREAVRMNFRRHRWARSGTFDASDPGFEREVAEFIGRHWNCFFLTYWMSL